MDFKLEPSAVRFTTESGFAFMQAKLRPDYAGAEVIELPEPEPLDEPFHKVIENRRSRRQMAGEGISLQELSNLLYHSCGVTGHKHVDALDGAGYEEEETDHGADDDHDHDHDADGHDADADHDHDADADHDADEEDDEDPVTQSFRAYASAGGLYPVENYLLVMNGGPDLPCGTYYYVPEKHGIRVLDLDPDLADKRDELFSLSTEIIDVSDASVVFALTGAFWRAMAKYGPRCYRYIMQESGHLAQNTLLTAEAMNLAAIPLAGFKDHGVNDHLGIDGINEAVIYTVAIGKRPLITEQSTPDP
ncbi:nitroreductase [Halobacteriales archaeon QS_1_68_20]|nr:MAG: nitroreductase [Halobacteriales archaeon QS_1_68_20]